MNATGSGDGCFWAALSARDRAAIEAAAIPAGFEVAEFLIREGGSDDYLLIIRTGWARVVASAAHPDAEQVVLALRGPGDVVGELAALGRAGRSAAVQAVKPVTALRITGPVFRDLMREHRSLSDTVLRTVADRLGETVGQRAGTDGASLDQRVARVLVEMTGRPGIARDTGPGRVTIELSQQELARIAGVSRESFARVLRVLRENEIVRTSRERLEIRRLDELRRMSEGRSAQ